MLLKIIKKRGEIAETPWIAKIDSYFFVTLWCLSYCLYATNCQRLPKSFVYIVIGLLKRPMYVYLLSTQNGPHP